MNVPQTLNQSIKNRAILDPINPNMNSDEFLDLLQKNIYEEIEKII